MKYPLSVARRSSFNVGLSLSACQIAAIPSQRAKGVLVGLAALAIGWGVQPHAAEARALPFARDINGKQAVNCHEARARMLPVGNACVSAMLPRRVTVLDKLNWKFVQDDNLTDAAALSGDASTWSTVRLPHTWNAIDAATTEQTNPTSQSYKRGKGWYRLEFGVPGRGRAATQWLQFDGASIVTDVWLNGEKLGQHKGAFTAFRFDVTGTLLPGRKNVLLVKTDNTAPVTDTDLTAIAPLSGDFNMSGGLYRGVSLISTPNAVHFALDDFGSSGVFARTTELSGGNASINVRVKLENDANIGGTYTVRAALLEADGKTLKSAVQRNVTIGADSTAELSQDLLVRAPHLWQGLEDPYLYKLMVQLKDVDGKTIDRVVHDFGIRTMTFDPNLGFFLNGKSMPLYGVNMHQDYYHKAWAIDPAHTDESLALIKEIGANTLRLPHYPHSQYTYQQADKLGLVVMAEVPFVNSSTVCGRGSSGTGLECSSADPEMTGFSANLRQQTQELVRQQYNHPSIGLWSIGNEMTILPILTGQTDANNNIQPVLHSLQALVEEEDPGRVTTLAQEMASDGDVIVPPPIEVGSIADTFSLNRYFLWYFGTDESQFGQHLDDVHAQYPTKPLGVSEYGVGAALTHHTDNPKGGRVCSRDITGARRICYQPEEYGNYVHESDFATILTKPYLFGTYVWNMFDFGSAIRHEGDIGRTNTKGLVTFDRETKKDPFFFYKANWSQEPVTYITGRRYTERTYPVADVTVYHNGELVTLTVNGTPVGTMMTAQCPIKVCKFINVPLEAGANTLVAEGMHASTSVTDTVTWNLSPDNANNIYIAAGQLTTGFQSNDPLLGNHRYGSDNFFTGGTPVTLAPLTVINGIGSIEIPETGRVWDAYREGSAFSYQIPLPNGTYKVTLGFLEPTATAAGDRVFNVDANGKSKIAGLDVFKTAGGQNSAIARSFKVAVTNGQLNLDLNGTTGNAIVSNIAVSNLALRGQ